MNRELSTYAFNTYGHDAKIYNGIHDLETRVEVLRRAVDWWLRDGRNHFDGAPEWVFAARTLLESPTPAPQEEQA